MGSNEPVNIYRTDTYQKVASLKMRGGVNGLAQQGNLILTSN
jgi:hypothetical protein